MKAKYRAFQAFAGKGLTAMQLRELTDHPLGPHDVRIEVRAVSLNKRDLMIPMGEYPVRRTGGFIPCSDGAGQVVEIGSEVSSLVVGDRVVGAFFRESSSRADAGDAYGGDVDGWLTERNVINEHSLVKLPSSISYEDAACMPCAGVTAWHAMFTIGNLAKGDVMLTQGTGGVACWSAALAQAAGIRCFITTSHPGKREVADRVSAGNTIVSSSYLSNDWVSAVLERNNHQGVKLVTELVGNSTILGSIDVCASGATIAIIGGQSGWDYPVISAVQLLVKQLRLQGVYVGSRNELVALVEYVGAAEIRPEICEQFSFPDASKALRFLESTRHVGKVVITM